MGLKPIDYVILIVMGIICVVIVLNMLGPVIKHIFKIEAPKQGEMARFVRYLGCAAAMCAHGCGSDEVITHALEYEGNKIVKSCKQLIDEHPSWCDDPGKRLCGTGYAFNFTFREDRTYNGNYNVKLTDTSTWGSCGASKTGWQTDASCIGDWVYGDIFDPCCESCKLDSVDINPALISSLDPPYGLLFSRDDGSNCGARSNEPLVYPTYDDFSGSIWLSENYVTSINPKTGNPYCEVGGELNTLKKCDFNKGEEFWLWGVENPQNVWIWEFDTPWGKQRWQVTCVGPEVYYCPKIVVCDYKPS